MNLPHHVLTKLRELVGKLTGSMLPPDMTFNPVAAISIIEKAVAQQQVLIGVLVDERVGYRAALCGMAWDYGQYGGHMPDLALLEWPPDPPQRTEEKKLVEVPKGLVSVH